MTVAAVLMAVLGLCLHLYGNWIKSARKCKDQ
jgi:hypothetical protein